jgi:hypothetical protein
MALLPEAGYSERPLEWLRWASRRHSYGKPRCAGSNQLRARMNQFLTEDQARAHLESPLEYPGLAVKERVHESLRLSRRPAFDPEAVWSLYSVGEEFFLRRIVYAVKSEGTRPWTHHTFGAESLIPTAKAGEILDRLGRISLRPFLQKSHIGIDGCIHAVRVGHYIEGIDGGITELSWWHKAPDDWSLLRDWYGATILEFESHLPASTVPIQDRHPWVE